MAENSSVDFFTELDWTKPTEELLVSWADIALCYTWIFDKSYRKYNHINYRFTIPIIVLSTITGTLSMSMNSLLKEDQVNTGQVVIGGVNIFIGILSTLQNFFRYAQQSELHLSATRDWAKLHRNIKIELSIERKNRKPASEFVRSARQEYERLLNSRPVIPTSILEDFKRQYRYSDVIKPEVLEKIRHIILDDDKNMISNKPIVKPVDTSYLQRLKSFIIRSPRSTDSTTSTTTFNNFTPSTPPPSKSSYEHNNTPESASIASTPMSLNRPITLRIPDAQNISSIEFDNLPQGTKVSMKDYVEEDEDYKGSFNLHEENV
jgi:hypothetical protein